MKNVIETLKDILSASPLMVEFNDNQHIDYNEEQPGNYGVYPIGTSLVKENILGDETYRTNFIIYANMQAHDNYVRLLNSNWLLRMTYWLNSLTDIPIVKDEEKLPLTQGKITSITCSNGMLFGIPTGNIADGVSYQLQIQIEYEFKNND